MHLSPKTGPSKQGSWFSALEKKHGEKCHGRCFFRFSSRQQAAGTEFTRGSPLTAFPFWQPVSGERSQTSRNWAAAERGKSSFVWAGKRRGSELESGLPPFLVTTLGKTFFFFILLPKNKVRVLFGGTVCKTIWYCSITNWVNYSIVIICMPSENTLFISSIEISTCSSRSSEYWLAHF